MSKIIRVFLDAADIRTELKKLCERFNVSFGGESQGLGKALSELTEKLPAADVRPVIHSRWEINSDGYYPYCKMCGQEPQGREMSDYCPNCGAKMDGEVGSVDE